MSRRTQFSGLNAGQAILLAVGAGAVAYIGYSMAKSSTQNRVAFRPDDDAPARTARDKPVSGRTITINRPRAELFAYWVEFSNLPTFMQGVRAVTMEGEVALWDMSGPQGQTASLRTILTERRDDEYLAWQSTEASDVEASGQITFRDAPAGRGTEIEAEVNYHPPLGDVGRWIGKLFQADPVLQGRRELRRFKMLMETGEIATNANQKSQH